MAGRSGPAAVGVAAAVLAVIGVSVALSSGDDASLVGDGGGVAGAGSGASPSGGRSPAAATDGEPAAPGPSVVAPRAQRLRPDVPLSLPIQSYELLAPDRLQVRYAAGVPECYGRLDRAVVDESASRVVVTLRLRPAAAPAGQPCPDIALVDETVVRLDRPLGGRVVLDGSGLRPVQRGHDPG
jgi:hypothetical protein